MELQQYKAKLGKEIKEVYGPLAQLSLVVEPSFEYIHESLKINEPKLKHIELNGFDSHFFVAEVEGGEKFLYKLDSQTNRLQDMGQVSADDAYFVTNYSTGLKGVFFPGCERSAIHVQYHEIESFRKKDGAGEVYLAERDGFVDIYDPVVSGCKTIPGSLDDLAEKGIWFKRPEVSYGMVA